MGFEKPRIFHFTLNIIIGIVHGIITVSLFPGLGQVLFHSHVIFSGRGRTVC